MRAIFTRHFNEHKFLYKSRLKSHSTFCWTTFCLPNENPKLSVVARPTWLGNRDQEDSRPPSLVSAWSSQLNGISRLISRLKKKLDGRNIAARRAKADETGNYGRITQLASPFFYSVVSLLSCFLLSLQTTRESHVHGLRLSRLQSPSLVMPQIRAIKGERSNRTRVGMPYPVACGQRRHNTWLNQSLHLLCCRCLCVASIAIIFVMSLSDPLYKIIPRRCVTFISPRRLEIDRCDFFVSMKIYSVWFSLIIAHGHTPG
jgi:hypothetical protein